MQTVLFEEANPSEAVSTEKETRLTAYFKLVRDGWRAEGRRDLEAPPCTTPTFHAGIRGIKKT